MCTNLKKIISILLSVILAFSINLIAIAENENSWKSKIDEKIYEEATDKNSVVPVYIWLTDVDHDEVIGKTEDTLGYGEKDLAVIDENISEELAVAISNLAETEDESVKDELQQYMKKTEKKRKAEKEKTDKYIGEKRKNYRDKYNEKSKDFLDKAKISEDAIIFRSEYAPMIIAELTLKQIESLAKSCDVEDISFYEELIGVATSTMDEICDTTNLTKIHNNLGITGAGVNVGIRDVGIFIHDDELPSSRFIGIIDGTDTTKDHINGVAKVFCGVSGVAPGANCYYVSDCKYWDVEQLISKGVSVINCSLGSNHSGNYYTNEEKWTDHIAKVHNVSFVHSAGNEANEILNPGLAYNVITVGAYNNKSDKVTDHMMYSYSNFNNESGCEKPDIVAPANMLGGGTSVAAPFVSGIIALMLEVRPSLAAYPQAVKAILLASCHHKALPASDTNDTAETMAQGITDKQGAGVVDAYRAISITGRGNYGVRSLTGSAVYTEVKFNVPHLYDATGINISIAWLRNNTISESDHSATNPATAGVANNLNLTILSGSTTIGTSNQQTSSTEMVYVGNPTADTTYTIRINKANSDNDTVRVGYAWSFDEEQFQYTDENDGIFFLKNMNSDLYLNYSSATGATQKSLTTSFYYQWVIQGNSNNGYYTLHNFYGNAGCFDVGDLISGNNYSVSLDSTDTAALFISNNNNGSVTFGKTINGERYNLGVLNSSTSGSAQIVWQKIETATDLNASQCWYLEPICYQVGDVNMDGSITADDSRTVLNYVSGLEELGTNAVINVLKYLADANSDGEITAADPRLILRVASGLE